IGRRGVLRRQDRTRPCCPPVTITVSPARRVSPSSDSAAALPAQPDQSTHRGTPATRGNRGWTPLSGPAFPLRHGQAAAGKHPAVPLIPGRQRTGAPAAAVPAPTAG